MGYVGLTLTAALARHGHIVYGVEAQPAVRESLARGRPHIYEPGLDEIFAELVGSRIFIGGESPDDRVDAVVICVSTPVDAVTRRPDLSNLTKAAEDIAGWATPETLVVVRS